MCFAESVFFELSPTEQLTGEEEMLRVNVLELLL